MGLAEHRDGDTWGFHLLDAVDQGLDPERTIADAGTGLRAGHKAVFGEEKPCHGDVFHLQHQCQGVVNSLERQTQGATTRRQVLEQEMEVAKQKAQGNRVSKKLTQARQIEQFFLNHRQFMRSEVPERLGKSPKELVTGEEHPHWLEMLGFERFQQA